MDDKQFKLDKAEAIATSVINFQTAIMKMAPLNTPDKLIQLQLAFEMFKAEMFMILATPMPKYPKGSPVSDGSKTKTRLGKFGLEY